MSRLAVDGAGRVTTRNGFHLGDIYRELDGYYVFESRNHEGYWESALLREIARTLDEMNAQWDEEVKQGLRDLDGRPDWDEYFLEIARTVALRADCSRRKCGAVIVKGRRIRATGYNGSPAGGPSCLAGECPRGRSNVAPGSSYDTGAGACIALHAEQNAIMYASRDDCEGATIYVNQEPCDGCRRMIAGSGIALAVWPNGFMKFESAP